MQATFNTAELSLNKGQTMELGAAARSVITGVCGVIWLTRDGDLNDRVLGPGGSDRLLVEFRADDQRFALAEAEARAGGPHGNKGYDAAMTAIEMARFGEGGQHPDGGLQ